MCRVFWICLSRIRTSPAALARVMADIGHADDGVKVLKKWIDMYGDNTEAIYLVRAHYELDKLETKYKVLEKNLKLTEFGWFKFGFVRAIERVLASIEASELVTKKEECERLPEDWRTAVYVQLDIAVKNNLAWWIAEEFAKEFELEALQLSEEIRMYKIRQCAKKILPPAERLLLRAYYLDTYASAILTFRGEQFKNGLLKRPEFCDSMKHGITAWEEARRHLRELRRPFMMALEQTN